MTAQIMLRPNARINPYIGFGIVANYYDDYNFEHYLSRGAFRYEMDSKGKVETWNFNNWQGSAGVDVALTDNWLLNAAFSYTKPYRTQPIGVENVATVGGLLGVKYAF
jgi:opacity protein-like surface antigen